MTMLPFSAVVGQDDAKLGLLLAAIEPLLGGVLLRGQKGSAKTTLARGLGRLVPGDGPFVELPLGATEDRVIGSLDLAELLTAGSPRYRPGLLAAAHGGVLYVDEINLLADHLVDVLLDVAVSGVNRVERDGISHTHPARFVLVASMTPEEGELRPQLLDRFGLAVDVVAPDNVATRAGAVTAQLAAEASPAAATPALEADRELKDRLAGVRPAVVTDQVIAAACRIAIAVGAEGLRADLMLCRAAAAYAGWCDRGTTTEDDLRRVASMVLAHRRRRTPFEDHGLSPDELDRALAELDQPDDVGQSADQDGNAGREREEVVEPDEESAAPLPSSDRAAAATAYGRQVRSIGPRGRYVRDIPATDATSSFAVVATAVAAASRRAATPGGPAVARDDLREAVREERAGSLVVLVVDTSGSMGAQRRIAAAKGVALGLLTDAYQRRNRVAVIAVAGERAALVMRPTGSIEIARARLSELPTGGTTPLADALDTALDVAIAGRRDDFEPFLVLITDGRATIGGDDPVAAAHAAAVRVAAARVPAMVVDAEHQSTRLGIAADLARALKAECIPLAHLDHDALERRVRRGPLGDSGAGSR
jgi:magnesium chelatase subunit D